MYIYNEIKNLVFKLDKKYGFIEVLILYFGVELFYKISGYLVYYKDDMFKFLLVENEILIFRLMICLYYIIVYNIEKYLYRDLLIRYSE